MSDAILHPGSIASAGQCLRDAASKALELLASNGHPPCAGSAADNLRIAIANYEQAMTRFFVTVKTEAESQQAPDHAAVKRAHRAMHTCMPLDEMLNQAALAKTAANVALQKPRKERPRFDWRKAQANDLD